MLLKAHYERLERGDVSRAEARLKGLMECLVAKNMAISFEMVTGKLPEATLS